jgi:antimicrobial peptide system SdpB family protein
MGVAEHADGHAVEGRPRDGDLLNVAVAALGRRLRPALTAAPWSSGLGLGRTVLALGTAATLAATAPPVMAPTGSTCAGVGSVGLFCAVPAGHGQLARWLAVAALLVVASGWRPRVTAIPHWYVSWSFLTNLTVLDGGDQITAILTLLLVPVGLTDARRWHWHGPVGAPAAAPGTGRLVAYVAIALIHVQVAVVYFQSSIAKLGVREWADGTAMYYFLQHPIFGAPPWLAPVTDVVSRWPVGVALLTWAPLVIEFALAVAILLRAPARRVLLVIGLVFHATIALTMGLVSFDLAMSGALLLYLLPIGHRLRFPAAVASVDWREFGRRIRAGVAKPIDARPAQRTG